MKKVYALDTTLGFDQNVKNEFIIYPNPTNDIVFFSDNIANEIDNIYIYQFDGKLIEKIMLASNSISLKDLSKGIYLMKIIKNDGVSFTRKIVKN